MSKIHTALKESAGITSGSAASGEAVLSSLDKKLIAAGVAPDTLAEAHSLKKNNGTGFFDHLIRKKTIDEIQLLKVLSEHFGLSFWPELPMESINIDFTQNVSIQYLKKHKIVPLITSQDSAIAVNDPTNFQPVDDLRQLLKSPDLPVVLSSQDAIAAAINMAYDMSRASAKDYFEEMNEPQLMILFRKLMRQPIYSMKPVTRQLLNWSICLFPERLKTVPAIFTLSLTPATLKSVIVLTEFYTIF
jgi:hypothetical protein